MSHGKLCSHCVDLTQALRGCGNGLGVSSVHYAMALVLTARAEGASIGDVHMLLDRLQTVDAFDRRADDVTCSGRATTLVVEPIRVITIEMGLGESNV